MIKAIETSYKGYRFRSRLEARWAVFFDTLGIEWLYETEGFENEDGCKYLPDFYLPETKTWVEVKGLLSDKDAVKLGRILDYNSPLPYFHDSTNVQTWKNHPGLLILGEIPEAKHGKYMHTFITHYKGLERGYATFSRNGFRSYLREEIDILRCFSDQSLDMFSHCFDGYFSSKYELLEVFTPQTFFIPSILADTDLKEAYEIARSARFEHGERGVAWQT